jgi:hypothetical protein
MLPMEDSCIFSRKVIEYSSEKFNYDLLIGNSNKIPTLLFNDALNEFEYDTKNNSIWNKFKMPIDFIPGSQSSAAIDLDSLGEKEFIINGLVKSYLDKDSVVQKVILIFDINSKPTLIFRLIYGCIPLNIYDKTNYTVWETTKNCDMNVEIDKNSIRISNSILHLGCCNQNRIENGFYVMKDGQIIKRK